MFVAFLVLLWVIILITCIPWLTHIDMIKNECKIYGWANYRIFKRELLKLDGLWEYNPIFENSLFYYNRTSEDSKIHADIFMFQGIGMIMRTPIDYWLAIIFLKRYIREKYNIKKKRKELYNWE